MSLTLIIAWGKVGGIMLKFRLYEAELAGGYCDGLEQS
ncbi:hypothetical protein N643_01535 [Salmonella bongori serovar 48:z41:-- str. RKS3044]|uniref:Uncharacterized protein n=1 Tax=Salmonella bongori N268-08 TaxID=1197719 RepID=S5MS94_SALBN|nr:hypothetical protein A464_323 [Salmonella bongori N268-08]AID26944.1 hypothetical protein N643_01535 [Salmonella bongori serovar 48:z41:-- str. RKS3044]